jgi:hypothetical protein
MDGSPDISGLLSLVATAKQQDNRFALKGVVNAIAWALIDTQFPYTGTQRLTVTEISRDHASQTNGYFCLGSGVTEPAEPIGEDFLARRTHISKKFHNRIW